jgi:hypothetical protein
VVTMCRAVTTRSATTATSGTEVYLSVVPYDFLRSLYPTSTESPLQPIGAAVTRD